MVSNQLLLEQTSRRPPRSFVLSLSAGVCITALFSVLVLAFKADGHNAYVNFTDNGHMTRCRHIRPNGEDIGVYLCAFPKNMSDDAVGLTLAAAGMSLVAAVCLGFLSAFAIRRAKAVLLMGRQRFGFFLLLVANCVLSLAAFIVCAVSRLQSAKFDANYRSPLTDYEGFGLGAIYDLGIFDRGSWSCQLNSYDALHIEGNIFSRECTDETAALWISLLLVLSNLGMASQVWRDWRGQRFLIRNFKALDEEYETDYI